MILSRFQGGAKVFVTGYGLQLCLKILMQMKKIAKQPTVLFRAIKSSDTFSLGIFMGGFSFLYRVRVCFFIRQSHCTLNISWRMLS